MKNLRRAAGLISALVIAMPFLVAAQTTGSSTVDVQIQALLSQITSLQQQLETLIQSAAPSSTSSGTGSGTGMAMGDCGGFDRDLSIGSQGSDVMQLQQMLSSDGFLSASSTGFFGPLTAHALRSFQVHFGIAASSSASGFFGSLTRNFLQGHCGGQGEAPMGSSTPDMMHPMIPAGWQGGATSSAWMASSTDHMFGPMGSSTGPKPPCPNNDDQGAAAVLFVPHVILPMMPCGGQGQGGPSVSY